MRRAAQAATIGFAALLAFQAALAAGVPAGSAAGGGAHADLTTGERVGSAVSVLFYLVAIVVVRRRAAGREERRYRWGIWGLVVVLAMSGLPAYLGNWVQSEQLGLGTVMLVYVAIVLVLGTALDSTSTVLIPR